MDILDIGHRLAKVRVASSNLVIRSVEGRSLGRPSSFSCGSCHCSTFSSQLSSWTMISATRAALA